MPGTNSIEARTSIRFCFRSYTSFVLVPRVPIIEWLAELDNWIQNSPDFFVGRPVVLDLNALNLSRGGTGHLLSQLAKRNIGVIGLEGADASQLGPSLPPLLVAGRSAEDHGTARAAPSVREEPTSLLIESPIRSGQTVLFPNGDVTVLGSVGSGSEIVAGGSIHVYGTLRGRAMAGSMGNTRARIFCRTNEAELVAIGGHYRTADELDANIRCRPIQCWLEDGVLMVASLE